MTGSYFFDSSYSLFPSGVLAGIVSLLWQSGQVDTGSNRLMARLNVTIAAAINITIKSPMAGFLSVELAYPKSAVRATKIPDIVNIVIAALVFAFGKFTDLHLVQMKGVLLSMGSSPDRIMEGRF